MTLHMIHTLCISFESKFDCDFENEVIQGQLGSWEVIWYGANSLSHIIWHKSYGLYNMSSLVCLHVYMVVQTCIYSPKTTEHVQIISSIGFSIGCFQLSSLDPPWHIFWTGWFWSVYSKKLDSDFYFHLCSVLNCLRHINISSSKISKIP